MCSDDLRDLTNGGLLPIRGEQARDVIITRTIRYGLKPGPIQPQVDEPYEERESQP